jgi:hypothetical protein
MLISPVSVKQTGAGTAMVWAGSGETVFNASPFDYSIGMPDPEPTVIGDRRFMNLNGSGTKMFFLNGANLTEIRDCMMGGTNWDIPRSASYVYVGGGRVAANMNVGSHHFSIEGCQVGGLLTVLAGTFWTRIDSTNKLSGITLGLGVAGSTIILNSGNGAFTDNSGNNSNTIVGQQVTTVSGSGGTLGFYGATPALKPTVAGSKGANAALGSLITALATLGLVTDTTT